MSELELERMKFMTKVNKESGRKVKELSECWFWIMKLNKDGYGHYQTYFAKARGLNYAHQASHHLFNDQSYKPSRAIPCSHKCEDGEEGAHRRCVNPNHLYAGTIAQNIADRDSNRGSYQTQKTSGSNNGNASFSAEQIQEIKTLRATGMYYKDIAEKFNCNRRTIERIITGQHYTSV